MESKPRYSLSLRLRWFSRAIIYLIASAAWLVFFVKAGLDMHGFWSFVGWGIAAIQATSMPSEVGSAINRYQHLRAYHNQLQDEFDDQVREAGDDSPRDRYQP